MTAKTSSAPRLSKHKRREIDYAMFVIGTAIIEGAVLGGAIEIAGKSEGEIRRAIAKWLPSATRKSTLWRANVDYKDTLLMEARRWTKDRHNHVMGVMFYAIWIEHWLNHCIATLAKKRHVPSADVLALIRESIDAKRTWILPLLGAGRLPPSQSATIKRIAEKRNEFVHYKWTTKPFESAFDDPDVPDIAASAERLVAYLRRYENRELFGGWRGTLRSVMRSLIKANPPHQAFAMRARGSGSVAPSVRSNK